MASGGQLNTINNSGTNRVPRHALMEGGCVRLDNGDGTKVTLLRKERAQKYRLYSMSEGIIRYKNCYGNEDRGILSMGVRRGKQRNLQDEKAHLTAGIVR